MSTRVMMVRRSRRMVLSSLRIRRPRRRSSLPGEWRFMSRHSVWGAATIKQFIESQQVRKVFQLRSGLGRVAAIKVGKEQEHFADAEVRIKAGAGRDEADMAFDLIGLFGGAIADDGRLPAAGLEQAE